MHSKVWPSKPRFWSKPKSCSGKGYTAVSITDIVNAVGITKPTLYYYFEDKETLFALVLVKMLEQGEAFLVKNHAQLNAQAGPADLEQALLSLASGYYELSPTSLVAIIRNATQHLNEQSSQKVFAAYDTHIVKPIEALFKAAQDQDLISKTDTRLLAYFFVSLLDSLTSGVPMQTTDTAPYEAQARQYISLLLNGLLKR
ncbi:MAG: TetR/AcrR family transcriptional regulator [Vampirovibrionales bacterium]